MTYYDLANDNAFHQLKGDLDNVANRLRETEKTVTRYGILKGSLCADFNRQIASFLFYLWNEKLDHSKSVVLNSLFGTDLTANEWSEIHDKPAPEVFVHIAVLCIRHKGQNEMLELLNPVIQTITELINSVEQDESIPNRAQLFMASLTVNSWKFVKKYPSSNEVTETLCFLDYVKSGPEMLTAYPPSTGPDQWTEDQREYANDPDEKALSDYISEINGLIGLTHVKSEVTEMINLLKVQQLRKSKGLPSAVMSHHLVFTGNPGTGKTTVARLLGKIYKCLGLLSKGELVETDRAGLVAGYVGQTALKTQEIIQQAMGGILFIDEAYSLASKGESDYGQEAIDTLIKAMEDKREDLIIIVAGYPDLMADFIQSNPGLKSRFNKYIRFDDYSSSELYDILNLLCSKNRYALTGDSEPAVRDLLTTVCCTKTADFGNARTVRNIFEQAITNQANRIVGLNNPSELQLTELHEEDFTDISV